MERCIIPRTGKLHWIWGKNEERLEVLASLCVVDISLSLLSGMALGITSSSSARGVCV
ncbi:uncharacterized protein B0T23DRAFT_320418 [Neurospora hispaniola]|uniref:Uncharacterized protein n=1 Tax=Neurospora hispaniola TaxID=588809 RepID=A0AAJ0I3N4_9PEZI|nr:hypothetical protein B0T23DRAFT_320418 [Neurospora hispaniola]